MKTILLLHDEARRSVQLLQNAVPAKVPLREIEAVAGCDCDRWGHPCRARCSTDTGGSNFNTGQEMRYEWNT
jgi:hypothetical protein